MFSVTIIAVLVSFALAKDNGLGMTPPMGWNTWCTLGKCGRDFCNQSEVLSIADAMIENGMRDAGYNYVNLDDCWADKRDENGNILPDMDRFPDGMASMITKLNEKGFKFGLYTDSGVYTCSSGGRDHKIPGSYGHYKQDAATYAKWGVSYVKMDWCNTKINGVQLDPHEVYKNMSDALNATGKAIWLDSCEWGVDKPWEWMGNYANSWRTGPDHHDEWKSTSSVIEINAQLGGYAGPGGWNDPDFIYTGGQGCDPPVNMVHCPGQSDTEYITEFTMWSIMAAPLLVATDVRNMTDIMKKVLLNKEMIAINQDKKGYGGMRVGYYIGADCVDNKCEIWSKDLDDGSKAIVLYNSDDQPHMMSLDFSKYLSWSKVNMRDLWAHKDIPAVENTYSVKVEPHGVKAYKVMKPM